MRDTRQPTGWSVGGLTRPVGVGRLPGRTVVLYHEVPDGSSHFDWLIDRGDGGRLLAYRMWHRVDDPWTVTFPAQREADHRREYLEYEGEVSRGRGRVVRVGEGRCRVVVETDRRVELWSEFGGVRRSWRGVCVDRDVWRFAGG